MSGEESNATAELDTSGDVFLLKVGGFWRLTGMLPQAKQVMPHGLEPRPVKVVPANLEGWDSSLPVFLLRVRSWCRERKVDVDISALPGSLERLFQLVLQSEEAASPRQAGAGGQAPIHSFPWRTLAAWGGSIRFVGECVLATAEIPGNTRYFSWRDFLAEMVEAGPRALPIIAFLSYLIGLTFAYEISRQLERFGAATYVTEALGISMLREIGPLIAAVVLAGRTGAAFAARIADMKLGGELDALEMLGVSPIEFLILPRVFALVLMMPIITLYSDFFGLVGGLTIAFFKLNIPAVGFWVTLQSSVHLTDIVAGVIKGIVYGSLVAVAGTLRGLQSERSPYGVGRATTSAVVTAIAAIITADAVFSPILKDFGK